MNTTGNNLRHSIKKVEVPEALKKQSLEQEILIDDLTREEKVKNRKGLKDFWGKFKVTLIDLFKEEEDHAL